MTIETTAGDPSFPTLVLGTDQSPALSEQLRRIKHLALDMDGTIYKGGTLFKVTDPFLRLLKDLGIGYTFLTNNPSKSVNDYLAHLLTMGIHATADQIYTSAQATIEFLRADRPAVHCACARRCGPIRAWLSAPALCWRFRAKSPSPDRDWHWAMQRR